MRDVIAAMRKNTGKAFAAGVKVLSARMRRSIRMDSTLASFTFYGATGE